MKIAVLGSGKIGGTVGKKWATAGHEIVFGSRDAQASTLQQLLASTPGRATADTVANSINGAAVVLFAIPAQAMAAAAGQLGDRLDNKIVIDATNHGDRPVKHSLSLLREKAPGCHLFRAFNNLGWENMADPAFKGEQADLFYCGDPGQSQTVVDELIKAVGMRPIYAGGVEMAQLVDGLGSLWFTLATHQGYGRHLAFKLLQD